MTDKGIVVGHDGSKQAQDALTEAFEMARALKQPLNVVRAFGIRTGERPKDVPFGYLPTMDELEEHTKTRLREQIEVAAADFPDVEVHCHAVYGNANEVLVQLSKEARMVIVANRGLSGVQSVLLGSVSRDVVQHAHCPVLVVRQ